MSLVTHFPGDIKSGKTLSAIYWTKRLMTTIGCPVFTNMTSLVYQGRPWAETLDIDKLLVDITELDLKKAYYKLAVLLIDEAHTLWATNDMRGVRGRALTAMIAQAGKRGLIVVYTAHLAGFVDPKVRELTQCTIHCKTPDEGRTVYWDVRDPREWREAAYYNAPPPPDTRLVLHNAWKQHAWYDTNEVIDPLGAARGVGATKSSKGFLRQLDAIRNQSDTAIPVSPNIQKELAGRANEVRREIIADAATPPPPRRRSALGSAR